MGWLGVLRACVRKSRSARHTSARICAATGGCAATEPSRRACATAEPSCPSHQLQASLIKEQHVKRSWQLDTPWLTRIQPDSADTVAYLRCDTLSCVCCWHHPGILSLYLISTSAPPANIPARVIVPCSRVPLASPSAFVLVVDVTKTEEPLVHVMTYGYK